MKSESHLLTISAILFSLFSSASGSRADATSSSLSMPSRLSGGIYSTLHDLGFADARVSSLYRQGEGGDAPGVVASNWGHKSGLFTVSAQDVGPYGPLFSAGVRIGAINRFGCALGGSRRRQKHMHRDPSGEDVNTDSFAEFRGELSYARMSEDGHGVSATWIEGARGMLTRGRFGDVRTSTGAHDLERTHGGRLQARLRCSPWDLVGEAEYTRSTIDLNKLSDFVRVFSLPRHMPEPADNVFLGARAFRDFDRRWRVHVSGWVEQNESLLASSFGSRLDTSVQSKRFGAIAVGTEATLGAHWIARVGAQEAWAQFRVDADHFDLMVPEGRLIRIKESSRSELFTTEIGTGLGFHTSWLELNGAIQGPPNLRSMFASVDVSIRI